MPFAWGIVGPDKQNRNKRLHKEEDVIKELIAAIRGSNKPRKDVVTRLVVNGEVYTDSDEVETSSTRVVNTGRGTSVLELIHTFETACGKQIPYEIVERRPGDVASSYADPTLAKQALGWTAKYTINDICASSWRWQSQNPNGYSLK